VRIGILGGTGPQGRGLGRRFAMAGHEVLLGSRDAARAQQTADELADAGDVTGVANADAARAELVVVAVPYEGHADLLASLADELEGKIVVDLLDLPAEQRGVELREPGRVGSVEDGQVEPHRYGGGAGSGGGRFSHDLSMPCAADSFRRPVPASGAALLSSP